MKTEVYEDKDAFLAAVSGTKRKRIRPDLPRGESGVGDMHDALMRLAKRGLMPRYRAGVGYDCWALDGRSTPMCDDYHAAIRAAERTKD